jgi:hypothetical protein
MSDITATITQPVITVSIVLRSPYIYWYELGFGTDSYGFGTDSYGFNVHGSVRGEITTNG